MQIEFKGNNPPIKSYNFGVMGNNAAEVIDFVLDSKQLDMDLTKFKAYVKSASPTLSFADKQKLKIEDAGAGKIKLSWKLMRKHTRNHSINVQLQFEDYKNDIVWQTIAITFHFGKTIEADKEIENQQPSVIQDLCKRVSDLEEKTEDANQSYDSYHNFPTVGKTNVIYIDTSEDKLYRWDDKNLKYYCVGSNYENIKIIFGGTL